MTTCSLLRRLTTTRSMSTTCTINKLPSPSPWLMLPPLSKGGDLLYNFYSLAEEKILTFNKRRRGGVLDSDQIPPDNAKFIGSSHGWLASFDKNSNHVFLSNPISGRHMKLPAIDMTLPHPKMNDDWYGRGNSESLRHYKDYRIYQRQLSLVDQARAYPRVILSCSPDKEGCQAMTTYGPGCRLAHCTPGLSTDWAPLMSGRYQEELASRPPWDDMVYCTRRGEFSTIQPLSFQPNGEFARDYHERGEKHCQMFHWKIPEGGYAGESVVYSCELIGGYCNLEQMLGCFQMPHLVCADMINVDHPLIVLRFLNLIDDDYKMEYLDPQEQFRACRAGIIDSNLPYKTKSFLVLKCVDDDMYYSNNYDWEVVEDLKGLALFVGMNHSFAVEATGKLRPNSIYFTDAGRITPPDPDAPSLYGAGHDIGIFDYEKKTVSPCYYPCDEQSCFDIIHPPPMWFTPSFD